MILSHFYSLIVTSTSIIIRGEDIQDKLFLILESYRYEMKRKELEKILDILHFRLSADAYCIRILE